MVRLSCWMPTPHCDYLDVVGFGSVFKYFIGIPSIRIRKSGKPVGLFVPALGKELHISSGIRIDGIR